MLEPHRSRRVARVVVMSAGRRDMHPDDRTDVLIWNPQIVVGYHQMTHQQPRTHVVDGIFQRARAAMGGPQRAAESPAPSTRDPHPDGAATRATWVVMAQRLAAPVLDNLAAGTLRARMPVEERPGGERTRFSHLEAVGRLLAGIAPWLELGPEDTEEGRVRAGLRDQVPGRPRPRSRPRVTRCPRLHPRRPAARGRRLSRPRGAARTAPVRDAGWRHPRPPDRPPWPRPATSRPTTATGCCSRRPSRPRWPTWAPGGIDARRPRGPHARRVVRGRRHLRRRSRVQVGLLRQLRHPPHAHGEILDVVGDETDRWRELRDDEQRRARRVTRRSWNASSDPTARYPPIGRSLAYRVRRLPCPGPCRRSVDDLPESVAPAQVRGALTAVIAADPRAPRHVRCRRLAAHRARGPPAGHRRALRLDRAACTWPPGAAAAGAAVDRPLLGGPARALDLAARLVRGGLPHRPRPPEHARAGEPWPDPRGRHLPVAADRDDLAPDGRGAERAQHPVGDLRRTSTSAKNRRSGWRPRRRP